MLTRHRGATEIEFKTITHRTKRWANLKTTPKTRGVTKYLRTFTNQLQIRSKDEIMNFPK